MRLNPPAWLVAPRLKSNNNTWGGRHCGWSKAAHGGFRPNSPEPRGRRPRLANDLARERADDAKTPSSRSRKPQSVVATSAEGPAIDRLGPPSSQAPLADRPLPFDDLNAARVCWTIVRPVSISIVS